MLFISGYTDRAMFDAMIAERELTILEKSLSAEGPVGQGSRRVGSLTW
jgi:hypothetical protein